MTTKLQVINCQAPEPTTGTEESRAMDSRTIHFPWRPQPLDHPWQMFLMDVITGLAIVAWYGLVTVVWYSLLLADRFPLSHAEPRMHRSKNETSS